MSGWRLAMAPLASHRYVNDISLLGPGKADLVSINDVITAADSNRIKRLVETIVHGCA